MRTQSSASTVIFMTIAIALAAGCASTPTALMSARVDRLFATWNRPDSPGCGVGVSRNGALIHQRGYGMASLERHVPITSSTVFPLASITKAFTAMSVLLAAERGLLSLDDEVSKYITEWSDREHHVTIRHLLTHTSGLRDAYVLLGWTPDNGAGTSNAILKMLARQRGLNFAPGSEYQYNNGGYNLLGTTVQSSTLHPVFKDAFVGDYVGTVRFSRDARGSITGFTLNRNSARGVRFERVKRAG